MVLIILFTGRNSTAQQSNSMYLMHDIPQSNFLNPAVQIDCRWFLGIPGFSSTHISYSNTAFTYMDLTEGNTWNLEQVEAQMHRRDLIGSELAFQLFAIGHRHKSYYFTFSIDDRAHAYQTVPRSLVSTALYGNYPSAGNTVGFDGLRSKGAYLRQFTLGASRVINRSIMIGIRIKLLFGKGEISSGQSDMGLYTDQNTFDLLADGNYSMNTSLPMTVEQDAAGNITGITWNEINYASFLLNRQNPGIAMDLGMVYRYNHKLTFSASLLDIGGLRWRSDLNNIKSEGTFIYDALEYNGDVISRAYLDDFIDSLQNAFDISVNGQAYTSLLPTQLFLGASYQLREKLSLGLVNRNLIQRSKLHSSITFSATAELTRRIQGTLSWSYLNNSIRNLGAVLALRGAGFQFHLASDNLLGFFQPFDTRTLNLRMGFNVLFGCPRTKKEELESASYSGNPLTGICAWPDPQKKRKKTYRKKTLR
jgi:hypothetical protein